MFNWLIARIIEPTEDTPPMMEDEDLYKYIINYHLSDRSTKSIKIMHGDVVIREGTKEDGVVNVIRLCPCQKLLRKRDSKSKKKRFSFLNFSREKESKAIQRVSPKFFTINQQCIVKHA